MKKEEKDYKTRRGWTIEEIATLSELKQKGVRIVEIVERLNRNNSSIFKKIRDMGADLYDSDTWKNYVSQGSPWKKTELRLVEEIMKMSELKSLGYPQPLLMEAYRDPKQTFATKVDPSKPNSTIIFDTAGFDKWIAKRIKLQTLEFASQRRRPARGTGWKIVREVG